MSESTVSLRAVIKDEISAQVRQIEASFVGLSSSFRSAESSASAFTSGIRSTAEAENALFTAIQNEIVALKARKNLMASPEWQSFADQQRRLKAEIDESTQGTQSLGMSWQSLASKYFLVTQAIQPLVAGFKSVFQAAMDQDKLVTRLNAVEGSAARGAVAMQRLIDVAKLPGLGLEGAAQGYASLRSLNQTATESIDIIQGLAKANAAMGGGETEFSRVMNQITQMIGKGKVMSEEIRTISESMPNFRGIMQQAFGTADTEAIAATHSVDEFLKKWLEFANKTTPAGETIANNMDNAADSWKRFKASLADNEDLKTATRLLAKFAEYLAKGAGDSGARLTIVRDIRGRTGNTLGDYFGGETEEQMVDRYFYKPGSGPINSLGAVEHADPTSINFVSESYKAYKENPQPLAAKPSIKKPPTPEEITAAKNAAERRHDFEIEASKNAIQSGNTVTIRPESDIGGADVSKKLKEMGMRDVEKANADREKLRQKLADVNEKIGKQEEKTKAAHMKADAVQFAVTEKRKSDILKKELDTRMAFYDKYANQVQGLAQNQLASTLRGEFSISQARRAVFETSTNMVAQWATESIAAYIKKSLFEKEQMAVDAATANAARAAELAASSATAVATTAAWAPAALAVTAATFGANASAGAAQYALLQTQVLGSALMPHANGGAVFGRSMANREEAFSPFVPGRIIPAHNSVVNNSTSSSVNHFHFHGSDEKTILRTLRNAGIDNRKVSRK